MALVYPRKKIRLYNPDVEAVRQAHYRKIEARAAQAELTPAADPVKPPETATVSQPSAPPPVKSVKASPVKSSLPHGIPENWRKLPFPELRALAQRLSGAPDENFGRDEARAVIAAFAGTTEN